MTKAQDSIAKVNGDIITIWRNHFSQEDPHVRWPMICPEPVTGGLVVVGCNPALPKNNYYEVPVFRSDNTTNEQIEDLANKEREARKNYPYYQTFRKLAEDLKLGFEHVDLFFFRETNQNAFKKRILNADGKLNKFGQKQVKLAIRLLTLSQPIIILVANAFAAEIFKTQFTLKKLDKMGLYWVALSGQKIPVFLSGMLTGQRALDLHSRERLYWHMNMALENSCPCCAAP